MARDVCGEREHYLKTEFERIRSHIPHRQMRIVTTSEEQISWKKTSYFRLKALGLKEENGLAALPEVE